jgi:hypothetical protein
VNCVIASAAKQSRGNKKEPDCFVAEPVIEFAEGETWWLLAMTKCRRILRDARKNALFRMRAETS